MQINYEFINNKEEFVNNTRIVRSYKYPSLFELAMSNRGEKKFKCAYVGANMYGCKDCKNLLANFYLYGDCEQIDSNVVKGVDMLIELAFEGNHQPINAAATLQPANGLPALSPAPEPAVVD